MRQFELKSVKRAQLLEITTEVNAAVTESGADSGVCNIFVPHTTAAVLICENADPDVIHDLLAQLEKMVPREGGYRHGEGNAQAHILSAWFGTSLNVPIADGRLALGRWQGVMFAEFDGPRQRKFNVSVMAETSVATRGTRFPE